MSELTFVNCARGDTLRATPKAVYRITFENSSLFGFSFDFGLGMDTTYDNIAKTGLCYPVSANPVVRNYTSSAGETATVDVMTATTLGGQTVADLVQAIENVSYRTGVSRVERLHAGIKDSATPSGAMDRERQQVADEHRYQDGTIAGQAEQGLTDLRHALYATVAIVGIIAVLVLVTRS